MSIKKYVVNEDHAPTGLNKGDTVYAFNGCTYGCVSDDEAITGIAHTSVTFDSEGDYPFKTVPAHKLTRV